MQRRSLRHQVAWKAVLDRGTVFDLCPSSVTGLQVSLAYTQTFFTTFFSLGHSGQPGRNLCWAFAWYLIVREPEYLLMFFFFSIQYRAQVLCSISLVFFPTVIVWEFCICLCCIFVVRCGTSYREPADLFTRVRISTTTAITVLHNWLLTGRKLINQGTSKFGNYFGIEILVH